MAKKKPKPEINWHRIFELRCRSKRGSSLSREESQECEAAYRADGKRYAAMDVEVFNATVPFGSQAERSD